MRRQGRPGSADRSAQALLETRTVRAADAHLCEVLHVGGLDVHDVEALVVDAHIPAHK